MGYESCENRERAGVARRMEEGSMMEEDSFTFIGRGPDLRMMTTPTLLSKVFFVSGKHALVEMFVIYVRQVQQFFGDIDNLNRATTPPVKSATTADD